MQILNHWFEQQRRFQKRFVSVFDAILGAYGFSYVFYRLRYFLLKVGIVTIAHVIEFYLLTRFFDVVHLFPILILRAISFIINGGWWGCLEVMRARIRNYYKHKDKLAISKEISNWLLLAVIMAVIIGIIAAPYLYKTIYRMHAPNLFDFYIFVILFQLASQLLVRTVHSGGYALKRIYRPFHTIGGPPIISLSALLALWPFIHQFSLPVSLLISSCFSLFWSLRYSLRMYWVMRFATFKIPNIQEFFKFLSHMPLLEIFFVTFASMALQIEGLLIIALIPKLNLNYDEFVIFYLAAPLIRAGFDWSKLFYFDLKRFAFVWQMPLKKGLNATALKSAVFIAIVAWLITSQIANLFVRLNYKIDILLLAFFILQAQIAYRQLIAFCEHRYMDVLLSSFFLIIFTVIGRNTHWPLGDKLSFVVVGAVFGFIYLQNYRTWILNSKSQLRFPLPFYDWLCHVKSIHTPVNLHVIYLPRNNMGHFPKNLQQQLATTLARGKVSAISKTQILYIEHKETAFVIDQHLQWLIEQGAGIIKHHMDTGVQESGQKALEVAFSKGFLTDDMRVMRQIDLVEIFQKLFPKGVWFDLKKNKVKENQQLLKGSYDRIYEQLHHFFMTPLKSMAPNPYYVNAAYQAGRLTTIFAVKKGDCLTVSFKEWQKIVHYYNLKTNIY